MFFRQGTYVAGAAQGYGLTTIGVGAEFDVELMRTLSEQASGSFYFLQDPAAVQEVFHEEVTSFLVPLAEEVALDVDIGDAYVLRGIYGTKLFDFTNGAGSIDIPNLQLAHRTAVDDHDNGGRRGGGGAILLELLRKKGAPATQDVGDINLRYRVPKTDTFVDEKVAIKIPVAPDQVDLENGTFEDLSVQKSFVMLNIYVGFQMAATRASQGDYTGAWNVLDSLDKNVDGWLATNPDFDIDDDLKYIRRFKANLITVGATEPPPTQPGQDPPLPPEPWPNDSSPAPWPNDSSLRTRRLALRSPQGALQSTGGWITHGSVSGSPAMRAFTQPMTCGMELVAASVCPAPAHS